jgi:hypothetical protein
MSPDDGRSGMSLMQHYDKVITRMQLDICRLIEEGPGFSIEHFNYKEEKDRYWHDRNQENARSYYGMD